MILHDGELQMSQQSKRLKFLSLILGASVSLGLASGAFGESAGDSNPFAAQNLHNNSKVAEMPKDGKCGEGKCSADVMKKPADAKCGSANTPAAAPQQAKCGGADKPTPPKEAKCGGK
jgi:uncharacterized low-complexity protein